MVRLIAIDEDRRALVVVGVVVLDVRIEDVTFDQEPGAAAVRGVLPGVVGFVAAHRDVSDPVAAAAVARIQTDPIARGVVHDVVDDFNILGIPRSAAEIADDDAVLVLPRRLIARYVVNDVVLDPLVRTVHQLPEPVIDIDPGTDGVVGVDVEALEDGRNRRMVLKADDAGIEARAGLDRGPGAGPPAIADIRHASHQHQAL